MALQTSIDNTDWAIVSFLTAIGALSFSWCVNGRIEQRLIPSYLVAVQNIDLPSFFCFARNSPAPYSPNSRTSFSNSELVLFRTFSILWGLLGILPSFHNHNNQCIGLRTKWFIITIITLEWSPSSLKSPVVWQPGHHEMVERSLAEWGFRFLDGVQSTIICNINVHRMIYMTIIV